MEEESQVKEENTITMEEESQVKELRRRMKGHMSQDLYNDEQIFIRFLRARDHNVDSAEVMLKNHIKWRIENKVDSILTDFIPHKFCLSKYFPLSTIGIDLDGSPVFFFSFGNWDFRGMMKSAKSMDIRMYIVYYLESKVADMKEYSMKVSSQTGKFVDKWNFIVDFENFTLTAATHKPTLEMFSSVVTLYEAHFPERLQAAYVINNSYYFTLFWAFIRPFFSPATAKKIHILGKTGWQDELLKLVSPDVLPEFLGGKRTDPDGNPMCKTVIRFGGPVPETYFEFANQTCSTRIPNAKKLNINWMSKAEVTLEVLHPGSSVEWEFVVKHRDIGFSVLHSGESGIREVIPQQRIKTSESTESGVYKCEKAGTYIIEFDNTYSWLHSKEVYYIASVICPS